MVRPILMLLIIGFVSPLRGDEPDRPKRDEAPASPPLGKELSSVEDVRIQRVPWTFGGSGKMAASDGGGTTNISTYGAGLKTTLEMTFPGSSQRLLFETRLPRGNYNIDASGDPVFPVLAKAYEEAFGVKIVAETRKLPVLVLRKSDDKIELELPMPEDGERRRFRHRGQGSRVNFYGNLDQFSDLLADRHGKIVVNEVEEDGEFVCQMELGLLRHNEKIAAWLKTHNLELIEAEREVEVTVVKHGMPDVE